MHLFGRSDDAADHREGLRRRLLVLILGAEETRGDEGHRRQPRPLWVRLLGDRELVRVHVRPQLDGVGEARELHAGEARHLDLAEDRAIRAVKDEGVEALFGVIPLGAVPGVEGPVEHGLLAALDLVDERDPPAIAAGEVGRHTDEVVLVVELEPELWTFAGGPDEIAAALDLEHLGVDRRTIGDRQHLIDRVDHQADAREMTGHGPRLAKHRGLVSRGGSARKSDEHPSVGEC